MKLLRRFLSKGGVPVLADIIFIVLLASVLCLRAIYGATAAINNGLFVISLFATLPVFISAYRALRNRKISVDLLAGIALFFSFVTHEWVPSAFISMMLACARLLDTWSDHRASLALESLVKLRPSKAKVKQGNQIVEIPIHKVKKGDTVYVALGDAVPVDGTVIEGEGTLDVSTITGESMPVLISNGAKILSASVLTSGSCIIRTDSVGRDTMIEKMIQLITDAEKNKAPIVTISDRFAQYYIIGSLVVSILLYVTTFNKELVLSVLLVVCADEIAVATPLAFLLAIGRAAKKGVIIKGAAFLEGLASAKTMIVDKTGTLTLGRLRVAHHDLFRGDEGEFLMASAALSAVSTHPAAKAIGRYLASKIGNGEIKQKASTWYKEYAGKGVEAMLERHHFCLGRDSFFSECGILLSDSERSLLAHEEHNGFNVTLVAKDKRPLGFFAIEDELKGNIRESISAIKELGVQRVVMLTGDNDTIAQHVALASGISEVRSSLLPEDKLAFVKQSLHEGGEKGVIVVGDGVNDAAALTLANVGIAMGGAGSDVSIEAADVVLMHDDFSKIPETMRLAQGVMEIAHSNFLLWGVLNVIGLTLVFTGFLSPSGAAAYNFLTDFIPLANALRALRY